VTAAGAIGVDDVLAAGEAGVALGAADDEPAAGIDAIDGLAVHKLGRDDGVHDVLHDVGLEMSKLDAVIVLAGNDYRLHPLRYAEGVLDRHLRFAVGAEIGDYSLFAHFGQAAAELVGQGDGQRHKLRRLVAGEAEHDPLITGAQFKLLGFLPALAYLQGRAHRCGDVGRLLLDRYDHAAALGVEAVLGLGVADLADGLAGDLGVVHMVGGGDLADDDYQSGGGRHLAGYTGGRVVAQDVVQDGVGDLVAHLVGVALGHRL